MNRLMIAVGRSLLKNADSLVISIALVSWQFLTRTPPNSRTTATLLGIYVLLRMADAGRRICEHASTVKTAPERETKRVFVGDPEAILELAKLRGYDAAGRVAPYLGKWITISGTYEALAESLRRDSIHLSLLLKDGGRINLQFAVDRGERLRELQEGQRITTICQIQQGYGFSFMPVNCELVRADPLPRAGTTPMRGWCTP
jgi:hypothetical protein